MATYTVAAIGTQVILGKTMVGIYNGTGSAKTIRINRIWHVNNQTSGGTAALVTYRLVKISAGGGGVFLNIQKHDSTNESMPAQIVASTGMSITEVSSAIIRRYINNTTVPSGAGAASTHTVGVIPSLNVVYAAPRTTDNTAVEALTLREGNGVAVICDSVSTAVSTTIADIFVEFTLASS